MFVENQKKMKTVYAKKTNFWKARYKLVKTRMYQKKTFINTEKIVATSYKKIFFVFFLENFNHKCMFLLL